MDFNFLLLPLRIKLKPCCLFQPPWLQECEVADDDSEVDSIRSASSMAKKYPVDPPPTYNQADLYSQPEVSPKKSQQVSFFVVLDN